MKEFYKQMLEFIKGEAIKSQNFKLASHLRDSIKEIETILNENMKKLQIDENQALKLYKSASSEFKQVLEDSFGKEYFNQKITDKIQDLDDILEYLNLDEDDVYVFNKNTKNKFERYINACSIIPKIVSVYNEGPILDWTNSSQYKYKPYYKKVGSGWVFYYSGCWISVSVASPAHYFKSSELSDDSVKKFNDLYIDFFSYEG